MLAMLSMALQTRFRTGAENGRSAGHSLDRALTLDKLKFWEQAYGDRVQKSMDVAYQESDGELKISAFREALRDLEMAENGVVELLETHLVGFDILEDVKKVVKTFLGTCKAQDQALIEDRYRETNSVYTQNRSPDCALMRCEDIHCAYLDDIEYMIACSSSFDERGEIPFKEMTKQELAFLRQVSGTSDERLVAYGACIKDVVYALDQRAEFTRYDVELIAVLYDEYQNVSGDDREAVFLRECLLDVLHKHLSPEEYALFSERVGCRSKIDGQDFVYS